MNSHFRSDDVGPPHSAEHCPACGLDPGACACECTRLREVNAELVETLRHCLEFLGQPIRDGDRDVPLSHRLAGIGGSCTRARIEVAIARAAADPTERPTAPPSSGIVRGPGWKHALAVAKGGPDRI